MRIRWTPAAVADLTQISEYLLEHYPHYRQTTLSRIYNSLRSLTGFPPQGPPRFSIRHP